MNEIIDFGRHPSEKLQQLFTKRPFQIQEPEKAKIIFLGRDANWDRDIEQNDIFFKEILEYLSDGIKYWKSKNFHTPMLQPYYKGDGKKYHQTFCKLGFTLNNAEDICFFELLSYCTYGSSSKNEKSFMEMVRANDNKQHLERIKNLSKMEKLICIPKGVKRIIDELELFDTNGKNVIIHKHFSDAISDDDLKKLKDELHTFLKGK